MSERISPYTVELDRSDLGRVVNTALKDTGKEERWFLFFKGGSGVVDQGIMTISEARKIADGEGTVKYFFDEDEIRYQEVGYHITSALDLIRERLEALPNLSVLVKEDDEKLGVQIMVDGFPQL